MSVNNLFKKKHKSRYSIARMYLKVLLLFLLALSNKHIWAANEIKECSDAKASGACKDIVETAIHVCEENQSEKPITAKKLRAAQDSKFDHQSHFGTLVSKFKDASKSARTDKAKQKLCQKSMTALKNDCSNACSSSNENGNSNEGSCEDGKEELDKLKKLCKKNEEAAEMAAELAEQDAALFENATSGGSNDNFGTSGSGISGTGGGASSLGSSFGPQGYISLNPDGSPNLSNNRNKEANGVGSLNTGGANSESSDALGNSANNDANNKQRSPSNTEGLESGALGNVGKKIFGSGGTNTPTGDLGASANRTNGSGDTDEANANDKNKNGKDQSPGYMFWGTPQRKKSEKRY